MDLYNCLDDYSIDYDDLLKIHTGHQNQSESDSDAESEKSEKEYWPTLYNSEQLKANVVNAKDLKGESSDTAKLNPPYLVVAKTLNDMVTTEFCYICNKNGNSGHYMASCHFKKVLVWIKKTAQTKDPNVLKMIYCEACNIGLDKSDNHYSTESHQKNSLFYCDLCKTKFKSHIPKSHFDKKHRTVQPKSKEIPITTQAEMTKAITPASANCTNHQKIAEKLQTLLTFTACLVCRRTNLTTQNHYYTKNHLKKIRNWIRQQAHFDVQNSEQLYCQFCVDIFSSDEIAEAHYQSQEHKRLRLYCTLCDKFVKSMNMHVQTQSHKRKEIKKQGKTITNQNASWPQELAYLITLSKCDICSLKFENHNEAYSHYISNEHQDNVAAWIANLENNKSQEGPVKIVQPDNPEQTILKNEILDELRYAIDKLYFSNTIPLTEALVHLKRLNRDIANICNKREKEESIACKAPPKPRASVGDTSAEFTNFKLNMELERLKMVLGQIDIIIITGLGIRYAANLVQVMKTLADDVQSIDYVDIDRIFEVSSYDIPESDFSYHTRFQKELDTLESIVTGENSKINSDVALDVIIRFNIKLENSIDNYRDNDFSSSDDDNSVD